MQQLRGNTASCPLSIKWKKTRRLLQGDSKRTAAEKLVSPRECERSKQPQLSPHPNRRNGTSATITQKKAACHQGSGHAQHHPKFIWHRKADRAAGCLCRLPVQASRPVESVMNSKPALFDKIYGTPIQSQNQSPLEVTADLLEDLPTASCYS